MEPLLFAFLGVMAAEWGDKTQWLALLLAARGARAGAILAGLGIGAGAALAVASIAGALVHPLVTPRALALLPALALTYAGIVGFIAVRRPEAPPLGIAAAFPAALVGGLLLELGDRSQFAAFALAARYGDAAAVAAGAVAGLLAAALPAALLGSQVAPLIAPRVRGAIAFAFLAAGALVVLAG